MKTLRGILAASLMAGALGGATAQVIVYPFGPPAVFGLPNEYANGSYGGSYPSITPALRAGYDPPGPWNRIGSDVSLNGTYTSGNMTRTGAPQFNAGPYNGLEQSYAATGVTGALSGSYRAGVGGTGGMADVPANLGGALAAAPAPAPAAAPAPAVTTDETPFPAAEVSPDIQRATGELAGGGAGTTGNGGAGIVGNRTYTATYSGNGTKGTKASKASKAARNQSGEKAPRSAVPYRALEK